VHLEEDGGYRLNLDYFRHHKEKIEYEWENGSPTVGALYSRALAETFGPPRTQGEPLEQRHKDIARSVQAMYEEAFFHLLNTLRGRAYRWRGRALSPHRIRHRRWAGGGLVPGKDGMGPTCAWQPVDRLRSAARRYEGNSEPQDQTPRIIPPIRPVHPS